MSAVVVGVDGCATSDAALDLGIEEAALAGWPVRVVHVFRPESRPGSRPPSTGAAARRAQLVAQAAVRRARERMTSGAARGVPVLLQVQEGVPHLVLERAAGPTDLLVVGAAGISREPGDGLGRTARHCVVGLPAPVLLVPVGARGPVDRVVVAVHEGPAAVGALQLAEQEAARRGLPLVVAQLQPGLQGWLASLHGPGDTGEGARSSEEAAPPVCPAEEVPLHRPVSLDDVLRATDLLVLPGADLPRGLPSRGRPLVEAAPCPLLLVP